MTPAPANRHNTRSTTMTDPSPPDRETTAAAARNAIRVAAFTISRDTGAAIITRPTFNGSDRTTRDIDPLAGMHAARELELASRESACRYIRQAREAGYSWHDIGTAMHLDPNGDPQQAGHTVAEAAYTYAAGSLDREFALRYGRSVTWTCHACDKAISDRGLCNGPADDEHGHARDCPRLAATITAWDADWEAGQ